MMLLFVGGTPGRTYRATASLAHRAGRVIMEAMCDCLCALGPATDRGHTLFAKNSDRPPGEATGGRMVRAAQRRAPAPNHAHRDRRRRRDTIGFVGSRPTWAWGVEHGVNEAGVAIGNEAIYTTLDPRVRAAGLIGIDLVRLGLERATTAADAVDGDHVAARAVRTGRHRPHRRRASVLVVVPDRRSRPRVRARDVGARRGRSKRSSARRAISNRTTITSFDVAHRHPRQPVTTLVDPRLRASRAVLAQEPVTVAALESHLRSHVGGAHGWTVCMHVGGLETTTAAMVAELAAQDDGPSEGALPARHSVPFGVRPGLRRAAAGRPPAWEDFDVFTPTTAASSTGSKPSSMPKRSTSPAGTKRRGVASAPMIADACAAAVRG